MILSLRTRPHDFGRLWPHLNSKQTATLKVPMTLAGWSCLPPYSGKPRRIICQHNRYIWYTCMSDTSDSHRNTPHKLGYTWHCTPWMVDGTPGLWLAVEVGLKMRSPISYPWVSLPPALRSPLPLRLALLCPLVLSQLGLEYGIWKQPFITIAHHQANSLVRGSKKNINFPKGNYYGSFLPAGCKS